MHRLGHDRAAYIAHNAVKSFVQWLEQATQSDRFEHQWVSRKSNSTWSCTDLCDALAKYQWPFSAVAGHPPGSSYAESADVLNTLSANLAAASSGAQMVAACSDVFRWGGVTNGNASWVTAHEAQLLPHVQQVKKDLQAHLTGSPAPNGMTIGGSTLKPALRFNSGMSKVYSLMVDGLIIYDSRVAAALGMAVLRWAQQCNNNVVPPELAFPWMPAKGAKGQAPNRNPGGGLPRLNQADGQQWAWSALYASMLLSEVSDYSGLTPRGLEAALFMIGYDLPFGIEDQEVTAHVQRKAKPRGEQAPSAASEELEGWFDLTTSSHENPFHWRMRPEATDDMAPDHDACAIEHWDKQAAKLLIRVGELVAMFKQLDKWFPDGCFPLLNSATDVRNGTARDGIGKAFFDVTRRNPPDSSRVTAICLELELIEECSRQARHWNLTNNARALMAAECPRVLFQEIVEQSCQGE